MTHVVYRCYDRDGALLYIGATGNLAKRLDKHRGSSVWHPRIARVESEPFPSLQAALAAERSAIREEQPPYNIRSAAVGSPRGKRLDPRRLVPGAADLIRAHIVVRGLSVRQLAALCGGDKYRTGIGHLVSGNRDTCSRDLAERLQVELLGANSQTRLFAVTKRSKAAA